MDPLLVIDDLHVRITSPGGRQIHALNGVSLELHEQTLLGVLGESGSGKSTLAKALLRMLPKAGEVTGGNIEFEGKNLHRLTEREMNAIRGSRIALISQEPGLALNPVMKVGDQIAEVLRAHRDWDARRIRREAGSLLDRVNLRNATRRIYDSYPHQLSGGQQQRVVIAQALSCNPALIIADEPTASLDSDTEMGILQLFRDLKAEHRTSFLLITHDPTILEKLADRVAVLYAGRIVEDGPTERIFHRAMHPYTKALLSCAPPDAIELEPGFRFTTIPGAPPAADQLAQGCSFSPRCSERMPRCDSSRPSTQEMDKERRVGCFLYEK